MESQKKKKKPCVPSVDPTVTELRERRSRRSRQKAAKIQREITRGKLLRAAYRLFSERGKDLVSVNEITDTAEVGFGSFYNHFASKEALHEALTKAFFDEIDSRLKRRLASRTDPAEKLSVTVRYAVDRAIKDRMWRRFLLRESFSGSTQQRGLEARMMEAIREGLDSGRFRLLEPELGRIAVAGGLIGIVAAATALPRATRGGRALGSRTAAMVLSALGLSDEDARAIAARPLAAPAAAEESGKLHTKSDRRLLFAPYSAADAPSSSGAVESDGPESDPS